MYARLCAKANYTGTRYRLHYNYSPVHLWAVDIVIQPVQTGALSSFWFLAAKMTDVTTSPQHYRYLPPVLAHTHTLDNEERIPAIKRIPAINCTIVASYAIGTYIDQQE